MSAGKGSFKEGFAVLRTALRSVAKGALAGPEPTKEQTAEKSPEKAVVKEKQECDASLAKEIPKDFIFDVSKPY